MGLMDMYELAGNEEALSIAVNFAKWFTRWSSQFTREEFDNILDVETAAECLINHASALLQNLQGGMA